MVIVNKYVQMIWIYVGSNHIDDTINQRTYYKNLIKAILQKREIITSQINEKTLKLIQGFFIIEIEFSAIKAKGY